MAVAIVNEADDDTNSAVTSFTLSSFDVGSGSNMALYVWANAAGPNDTISSVVYDPGGSADSMDLVGGLEAFSQGSANGSCQWFRLLDASLQKDTSVDITVSGDLSRYSIIAISFSGVNQTDPDGTVSTSEGDTGNGTTADAVSTTTGDMVLSGCHIEVDSAIAISGDLTEFTGTALPNDAVGDQFSAGWGTDASSVSCDWDWDTSTRGWAMANFNINQATADGASVPFPQSAHVIGSSILVR